MKFLALTLNGTEIQAPLGVPSGGIADGVLGTIVGNALGILFALAVLLVTLLTVWGGIQWITSQGDKQKVAAARNRIIYAIIGLVVVLLSVFIVNIILAFVGAPELGKN